MGTATYNTDKTHQDARPAGLHQPPGPALPVDGCNVSFLAVRPTPSNPPQPPLPPCASRTRRCGPWSQSPRASCGGRPGEWGRGGGGTDRAGREVSKRRSGEALPSSVPLQSIRTTPSAGPGKYASRPLPGTSSAARRARSTASPLLRFSPSLPSLCRTPRRPSLPLPSPPSLSRRLPHLDVHGRGVLVGQAQDVLERSHLNGLVALRGVAGMFGKAVQGGEADWKVGWTVRGRWEVGMTDVT